MRRRMQAKMWAMTFYTFSANAQEIRQLLRRYEDPNAALARLIKNPHRANEQLRVDAVRALHNFLAAAKSLVDHSRNFIREVYRADPFWEEYQAKVKAELAPVGAIAFVHDLRNYMVHRGIPLLRETYRFVKDEPSSFSVSLDLGRMRSWENWSAHARVYMATLPDHVRLAPIIEDYVERVVYFHKWVTDRRKEIDRPHLIELNDLRQQLQELESEG